MVEISESPFQEVKKFTERATVAIAKIEDMLAGIVTAIVAIAGLATANIIQVTAQPEQFRGYMNLIMLGAVAIWAFVRFVSMYSSRFMEPTVIRAVYFTFVLNSAILIYSYRLYISQSPVWPYMLALSSAIVATAFVLSFLGYGLFRVLRRREQIEEAIKSQEELFKEVLESPKVPSEIKDKIMELRLRNLRLIDTLIMSTQKYASLSRGSNVLAQSILIAAIATGTSAIAGGIAAATISGQTFLWAGIIETVAIIIVGILVWYFTRIQERVLNEEFSALLSIARV
ncbi:MAG: hypothetical protein Q6368_009365 [Candidatus Baldrarchaeota archaeon]|nr:hypothetical protein [Candidatus Baldrarchaeota archaeon]